MICASRKMEMAAALPNNFLGIPEIDVDAAEAVILPVPYEATTTFGQGTRQGPAAIIRASQQIELFDRELGGELPNRVKIATARAVSRRDEIEQAANSLTEKFLIALGGEHSITPWLVKPLFQKYPDLSVLQIDAHTDLRDEYEGKKDSHGCAMRRVQEQLASSPRLDPAERATSRGGGTGTIVQVGIRSTALEEQPYIRQENIFWGNEFTVADVLARLSQNVYLTFDVDALDISIMPATGTPEPGGLSYEQGLELLKAVAQEKNLVAADFVELLPLPNQPAYDFLVAKLIYKLIVFKYGESKA